MSNPDVTRDSFNDNPPAPAGLSKATAGAKYVEVIFQRNKDVLDAELNELQRIIRVSQYRGLRAALGDQGGALGNGLLVEGNATANQVVVRAGIYVFLGYAVELTSDIIVSGLTTPGGGDRVDTVWLKLTEDTIDETTDTGIAAAPLGQTTQRQRLIVTIGVTENSTSSPDDLSNNMPWQGGVRAVILAHLYRPNGNTTPTNAQLVDRRNRLAMVAAGQDRNTFFTISSATWNGTTLGLNGLAIKRPGDGSTFSGSVNFSLADGEAVGWTGGTGFLYRRHLATNTDFSSPEGAGSSPTTHAALSSLSAVGDSLFLLALRVGSTVYLRDGQVLHSGDRLHYYGQPSGFRASNSYAPLVRFMDMDGNVRGLVDHLGYPGGRRSQFREDWLLDYNDTHVATSVTGAGKTLANNYRWRLGSQNAGSLIDGDAKSTAADSRIAGRVVTVRNGSGLANGDTTWIATLSPLFRVTSFLSLVIEWSMSISVLDNNVDYKMGLFPSDGQSAPAMTGTFGTGMFVVSINHAVGHWRADALDGGSTSLSDTGVAPSVGASGVATLQRFRIEVSGTDSAENAYGGNVEFSLFINDVGVATNMAAPGAWLSNSMTFAVVVANTGVAPSRPSFDLGPVRAEWNHALSISNL